MSFMDAFLQADTIGEVKVARYFYAYPSNMLCERALAREIKCAPTTVATAIKQLESKGFIRVIRAGRIKFVKWNGDLPHARKRGAGNSPPKKVEQK
jgi:DNA-binding transcriptional regulator YhcF (GntR family)